MLLLLGISKRPPVFPVVKLCLSKLQKPFSLHPPPPNPYLPSLKLFLSCYLHVVTPSPPFPASPGCTHTSVLQSRQSHFLPSAREEQCSGGSGLSGCFSLPSKTPQPRPTSSSSPPFAPGLDLQGSPFLGQGQLACLQASPHPLRWATCFGCEVAQAVVGTEAWRGSPPPVSSLGAPHPHIGRQWCGWGGVLTLWQPLMVEGQRFQR